MLRQWQTGIYKDKNVIGFDRGDKRQVSADAVEEDKMKKITVDIVNGIKEVEDWDGEMMIQNIDTDEDIDAIGDDNFTVPIFAIVSDSVFKKLDEKFGVH